MGLNTTTRTVNDVLTEVKRTFGDEASIQVTDADIIRWTEAAQREILVTNQVLKAVGSTDVIGGVSEYSMDGLNILTIQSIHYNGRKLDFRTFQEAEEYITSADPQLVVAGEPILWYEWGGVINLYPVPSQDATAALKVYYIKQPDELVNSTSKLALPDIYFDRIIQYVLARAYELDEDSENSQFKLGQFSQGLDALSERENVQGTDTYPRITVLEEDMW